jgi:peptidoglycan/xylan/chitin deacetylase (PgdA/CDA1 family)
MYHRISRVQHDPWALAVDPERFEEQMDHLKRNRTVMSVQDLIQQLRSGALPAEAVAVTFDDGYRDNLINAKPVLLSYGVPATLFLATGYIDRRAPFWWDELAAMILESTRPTEYRVHCGGQVFELQWPEPERSDMQGGWRASEKPITKRQSAFMTIWRHLQRATPGLRDRIMNALRVHFEMLRDPLGIPMSSDEVRDLVSDDIVTLGAHTVTHAALTRLSRSECLKEVVESRDQCRALAGKPIEGFAYPYGDMSPEVRNDVAASGFRWACSTEGGFIDGNQTSLYALPRIVVPNAALNVFLSLITD